MSLEKSRRLLRRRAGHGLDCGIVVSPCRNALARFGSLAVLAISLLSPVAAIAASSPDARQVQAVDITPDPFSFATVNNATPGIGYITEPLTVTGITGPSPISVVIGAYKINDGPYLSQPGTVRLNDRVVVLVRASTRPNKSVSATLTIGGVSAIFTVNTGDLDTSPDSFSFAPVNDAELGRTYVSAPATISGITERAAIVVTGGRYRINAGAFTSDEGTVSLGDQVYAEVIASSAASKAKTATVTIGGVAGSFTVTTAAAGTVLDPVPDSFSFAAVDDAVPDASYVSAPATITGISGPSPISVSGGRYRINAGGFTSTAGTVYAGDQVYAEVIASSLDSTATTATVTVGGVAAAFTVTTAAETVLDPIPDNFSFTPINEAVPGATYVSAPATITGISGPSPISISGGRYRINAGGFTSAAGTVNDGDQVYAEVIASTSDSTATTASITIGGVTANFIVTTAADTGVDTTPDSFSFTPVVNARTDTSYTSNEVTITGINAPTPISIVGGFYRINDTISTAEVRMVDVNDRVSVTVRSSRLDNRTVVATLTVGGVASSFSVSTGGTASDTVPDSFSFAPVSNAARSVTLVSNPATISGINSPSPISVAGGRYRINAGSFTTAAGTVNAGDLVYAEVVASSQAGTATTATITIGGVAGAFTVTTAAAADTTPDSFTFAPVTNAAAGTTYLSNPATITGITGPSPISVSGGRYRINSGSFTTAAGTVNAGDQVYAEVVAANSAGTAATATITVGGISGSFTVTTANANDTVPDSFSFAPVSNAQTDTSYTSNEVIITGINAPSPISVVGGFYRLNNGINTSNAGTVKVNDRLRLVVRSSRNTATSVVVTVTVGGFASSFTVTTSGTGSDSVPDSFSFTPVSNAARSVTYVSNPATITGINRSAPISVTGGRYRINAGSFTSTAGTVNAGDQVYAEVVASSSNNATTTARITIGGVVGSFAVTTAGAADTTPDSFSFAPVNNADLETTYVSTPAVITGINGPSPISVSGGFYKINDGPATATAGTVNVNDRVSAQLTSSDQNRTAVTATVTIGGVRAPFTVTTAGSAGGLPRPAEVLDFSNWKLTLPVNSSGNTSGAAAEIMPAALIGPPGYTSPYMYTDATGAVVFYAPTNGASTTPGKGSDNARSELRELYKVPSGPTEWTNSIGGTLTALCRVDKTPVARKQVIIGQIHGTSSILVLLVYDEALRVVEARYYNSPGGSTSKVQIASNVKIGDLIDYRIQWIGSTLSITVNGKTDTRETVSSWNGVKVYFKAGAYSGTGNTGNPAGDASQVAFFNLDVRH